MNVKNSEIEITYDCDILVIGSGVSGYCAAIQAGIRPSLLNRNCRPFPSLRLGNPDSPTPKNCDESWLERCGCNTILVEKDEVLGGNSGPNLGVGITGADRYNAYATETGIIQELQEDAAWTHAFTHVSQGTMPYSISRRNEAVVQEHLEKAGILVLKRHFAKKPIIEGNRIVGVIVEDLAAFRTVKINVRNVVIEASGDGHIGALAGADFDMGSEGKDEFSERSAPNERTSLVQGTSLVAIAHKTNHEVVFNPPADIPPFQPRIWQGRISGFLRHHDGWFSENKKLFFLYITETGGQMDTIEDDAEIYEKLLKQLWSEWNHIKNGPHKEHAKCWDLLWVSPKAGKRESRRFLGDYVIIQTDLEEGRRFHDDIAYGGHDLDVHKPLKENANIFAYSIPPMYGIPYRCCYSRNIDNLFLAGRLISATHLAHASTRVMRTGAAIGQAVGMAASMCCEYNCNPRDIYSLRLDELQQRLLRVDATILAKPLIRKSSNLAVDIARNATVSTTSELCFNQQEPKQFVPLISSAGNILWNWASSINSVEFFLRNDSDIEQNITISVYRTRREPKWKNYDEYHNYGRNDLRDSAFYKITRCNAVLPQGYEGWYKINFPEAINIGKKDSTSDDDRILIALDKNPDVSWAVAKRTCEIAEMVEHSHHMNEWKQLNAMGTMYTNPPPHLGEAENVINGFHRRFSRGPTNMWISDTNRGLPQDLVLSWNQIQEFNQVTLTFDNLPQRRHGNPWESGKRVLDICIKEYELSVWKNNEWKVIIREECNYHRFRVHSFESVVTDKLHLRILSTHGEKQSARVYQISVYNK